MKKIIFGILIIIPAIFLLSSVKKEKVSETKLVNYVLNEKNGLVKESENGNVKISLTYRPTDLLVSQEIKSSKNSDNDHIKKLFANYSHFSYFLLSCSINNEEIVNNDLGDQVKFEGRIKQLSFEMGNYIKIITSNKDTVPLSYSEYSRLYGLTGSTTLLLLFNSEKIKQSEYFDVYMDDIGIGSGENRFRFNSEDIYNTPSIFNL